jgi:formate hydrogenlyase subunit 3/multisubunit Na+/H+ antiporter MnhD subunit
VLLARTWIVLLIGWELMTLSSYLLVTHEHRNDDVRRAGWIYLIASHLGVACLVAMSVLMADTTGTFELGADVGGATGTVCVLLAIAGFGVKAGIVPMHVWLPEAHAAAPSHVSAVMSGVMIKLGVYGILRTLTVVDAARWAGPLIAVLGLMSAVVGISLAVYQRDLKRTLAYSSIENVGVILLGLGVGLWGASHGHPVLAAFGLFGGMLHVWSHVLMKGLLFLGAGSALHATGTRDLERLGGLLARMPRTGTMLVIGAVAIAALPPLAGFASEWLVYLGLLDGGVDDGSGIMLFAIAALATVGVLAALCFVRLIGLALLGQPRSEVAAQAHESGPGLLRPMALLAGGVIVMPFVAPVLVRALEPVANQIGRTSIPTEGVVSALGTIAIVSLALWVAIGAGFLVLRARSRGARSDDTWGCGYVAPTSRMQYTSGSFSESESHLLPRALRPRVGIRRGEDLFPAHGHLTSDRRDPFTRSAYEPVFDRLAKRFAQLRWVQRGSLHLYLVYIVVALIIALAATSFADWVSR